MGAGCAAIHLREAVKDRTLAIPRDADSRVADLDAQRDGLLAFSLKTDPQIDPAAIGEFDRVAQ